MIAALQSLRFVFVMMIFMSHFAYGGIRAFDAGGDCGVVFFFILSGFVLSIRYGSEIRDGSFQYGRFLKRRFWKLYPLHLLCLVFFMVVSKADLDWSVLLNILLLQTWIPNPDYYFSCNSVSWFLSCLFFCYLMFPFAYKRVSKWWLALILAAYFAVFFLTPYDKVNAVLYVNPLVRFVDFYLGIVIGRFFERGYDVPVANFLESLWVVFLVVGLVAYPWMDEKLRTAPLYWMLVLPMIVVYAKEQGFISSWLRRKPMVMLSSLAMPVFMSHQMLINILLRRLPEWPAVVMLFACILVALVVSWCIDRFFLRLFEGMR